MANPALLTKLRTIRHVRRGVDPIRAADWNTLVSIVGGLLGSGSASRFDSVQDRTGTHHRLRKTPRAVGGGILQLAVVKSQFNDYLICDLIERDAAGADTVTTEAVPVAKQFMLRHALENYPQLDDLQTVLADEVDATIGTSPTDVVERWRVTPDYWPFDDLPVPNPLGLKPSEVFVFQATTGLQTIDAEPVDIEWQVSNVEGRVWAVDM